jgi:hypothetical protein
LIIANGFDLAHLFLDDGLQLRFLGVGQLQFILYGARAGSGSAGR